MIKIFLLLSLMVHPAFCAGLIHESIEISGSLDQTNYLKTTSGTYDPSGTTVYSTDKDNFIKIRSQDLKGKSEDEMRKAFKKNINQYSLLFQDRVSPYTGGITVNTECFDKNSTKHKVITSEFSVATRFDTTATANFLYGKCDGEGQGYHSRYFIVVCKKNKVLYDVRLFSKDARRISNSEVKCIKK